MKRIIMSIFCFFAALAAFGQNTDSVTLDEAIRDSAAYLTERLASRTTVTIVNFTASREVSDYVIDELTSRLINQGNFIIVDRNLQLIETEMNFQLSGEVSDESAQAIGKKLGAQTIISGGLAPFGTMYRMHIKALEVETARIQGSITYTVRIDTVMKNLAQAPAVQRPAAPKPSGPKTRGEKIGMGALNILFGLGSYLEGDTTGGLTLTAGYAIAAGLFAVEILVMDWDNPAVGLPATIGVSVAGLTLVYGFARPFIYDRSPRVAAVLDNMSIGIVPTAGEDPDKNGIGVKFAYTIQF